MSEDKINDIKLKIINQSEVPNQEIQSQQPIQEASNHHSPEPEKVHQEQIKKQDNHGIINENKE